MHGATVKKTHKENNSRFSQFANTSKKLRRRLCE